MIEIARVPINKTIDHFMVKIFRGRDELARAIFHILPRDLHGSLLYTGSADDELDLIMASITHTRLGTTREWQWPVLADELVTSLTMATGGRYVPRFHQTPARDGRDDESLHRCFHGRCAG